MFNPWPASVATVGETQMRLNGFCLGQEPRLAVSTSIAGQGVQCCEIAFRGRGGGVVTPPEYMPIFHVFTPQQSIALDRRVTTTSLKEST